MKDKNSQTVPPTVEDAIKAIVSSVNAGEIVIFCGAGISRDSGLPIVNEFIPYILLTLCVDDKEILDIKTSLKIIMDAQQRQDKVKQIIAKKMGVSLEVIDKIINNLPFEAFIEILRDNSKIDNIFDIYDVEAYEPNAEPNTNHMMLARLVVTGKVRTIVTTNFDQLIEKALKQLDKQSGRDYDVIYREEDFKRINWASDRCRLIKLHGSINDKQDMAITLSQVAMRELSAARAGVIRHIFSQGDHKTVLILGYSCSDVFDLSPQIEALKENHKRVYLVQHSSSLKIENICEQEQKNPFKAFSNSTRLFLNTNNLVKVLWEATLKEPYEDYKALNTTPDWNTMVQAWYADSMHAGYECIRDLVFGRIFYSICEWRAAVGRYERVITYVREHVNDPLEGLAVHNMGNTYVELGEYHKAIELFEQALEIHRDIGDVQGEGSTLGSMGSAYVDLGEYHKAIELYKQCLEISRRIKDVQGEGNALANIGLTYRNLGEYHKAIELFEQALEIHRAIGDVQNEGNVVGNIGLAYSDLGEYHKAIKFYEQTLKIQRNIGNVQGEGNSLGSIGNAYRNLGEYHKAIKLYEEVLKIHRRIEDVQGEANTLGNMGITYRNLGEYRKAIGFFEQHLEITHRIGDLRGEGRALGNIGIAYANLGEHHKAIDFFEQHLEIARRIGDVQGEANALGNMGNVYVDFGEYTKAIELFEQHLEIARRIGDLRGEGSDLCNIGGVYVNLGEYHKAIELFEQHLEIARRIGDVRGEGSTLANIGSACALMGDKEKAARTFTQSKAIFAKLGLQDMVSTIDRVMKQVGL